MSWHALGMPPPSAMCVLCIAPRAPRHPRCHYSPKIQPHTGAHCVHLPLTLPCFPPRPAAPDTDKMIAMQLFLDVQEFGRQAKQVCARVCVHAARMLNWMCVNPACACMHVRGSSGAGAGWRSGPGRGWLAESAALQGTARGTAGCRAGWLAAVRLAGWRQHRLRGCCPAAVRPAT